MQQHTPPCHLAGRRPVCSLPLCPSTDQPPACCPSSRPPPAGHPRRAAPHPPSLQVCCDQAGGVCHVLAVRWAGPASLAPFTGVLCCAASVSRPGLGRGRGSSVGGRWPSHPPLPPPRAAPPCPASSVHRHLRQAGPDPRGRVEHVRHRRRGGGAAELPHLVRAAVGCVGGCAGVAGAGEAPLVPDQVARLQACRR